MPRRLDAVERTALLTAALRAAETKRQDRLYEDPYAAMLAGDLGPQLLAEVLDVTYPADGERVVPSTPDYNAIRTRFFDGFLQHAARRPGMRQMVLAPAGMDSRAYRLEWPDAHPLLRGRPARRAGLQEEPAAVTSSPVSTTARSPPTWSATPGKPTSKRPATTRNCPPPGCSKGCCTTFRRPRTHRVLDRIAAMMPPRQPDRRRTSAGPRPAVPDMQPLLDVFAGWGCPLCSVRRSRRAVRQARFHRSGGTARRRRRPPTTAAGRIRSRRAPRRTSAACSTCTESAADRVRRPAPGAAGTGHGHPDQAAPPSHVKFLLWTDVMYRATALLTGVTYRCSHTTYHLTEQTLGFWAYLDRTRGEDDYEELTEVQSASCTSPTGRRGAGLRCRTAPLLRCGRTGLGAPGEHARTAAVDLTLRTAGNARSRTARPSAPRPGPERDARHPRRAERSGRPATFRRPGASGPDPVRLATAPDHRRGRQGPTTLPARCVNCCPWYRSTTRWCCCAIRNSTPTTSCCTAPSLSSERPARHHHRPRVDQRRRPFGSQGRLAGP